MSFRISKTLATAALIAGIWPAGAHAAWYWCYANISWPSDFVIAGQVFPYGESVLEVQDAYSRGLQGQGIQAGEVTCARDPWEVQAERERREFRDNLRRNGFT